MKATPKERELAERIVVLEAADVGMREEYARYHHALEGLMRAVLQEVCVEYNHPTSIACGRLIAAVETASRIIQGRGRA